MKRFKLFNKDGEVGEDYFFYITTHCVEVQDFNTTRRLDPVGFLALTETFGRTLLADDWKYVWDTDKFCGHRPIPLEKYLSRNGFHTIVNQDGEYEIIDEDYLILDVDLGEPAPETSGQDTKPTSASEVGAASSARGPYGPPSPAKEDSSDSETSQSEGSDDSEDDVVPPIITHVPLNVQGKHDTSTNERVTVIREKTSYSPDGRKKYSARTVSTVASSDAGTGYRRSLNPVTNREVDDDIDWGIPLNRTTGRGYLVRKVARQRA